MSELAGPYDVTVQAVSKHLRGLEGAGMVSRSRPAQRGTLHEVRQDERLVQTFMWDGEPDGVSLMVVGLTQACDRLDQLPAAQA